MADDCGRDVHLPETKSPNLAGETNGRPIVLFDRQCRLCLASVDLILRRECKLTLLFCPLQSSQARIFLGLRPDQEVPTNSILVVNGAEVLERSDATIFLAGFMRFPWSWARALRMVPRSIRDRVYDWVSRNRIRWFGRPRENLSENLQRHAGRFLDYAANRTDARELTKSANHRRK